MSPLLTTILISLAKTIGLIFVIILPMVSYTVYAERRVSAMIQDRTWEILLSPLLLERVK
jgi:NADH-quinone oxidoreductase subunit H